MYVFIFQSALNKTNESNIFFILNFEENGWREDF